MQSFILLTGAAALVSAQYVPPPSPVLLTSTKSGVLPILPTPFNGVDTLEGAIIKKAPINTSYVPLNGPAQAQSNLPAATYSATLPSIAFNELTGTVISGTVTGSTSPGANGVTWTINLSNLPDLEKYGPFGYHIHDKPVPADGNCTETLGHFDYTNAGEYYTCNNAAPENCQTGDLAGKHGKVTTSPTFTASYVDQYLSTDPRSPYFFGAKSITIHTSNTTRLTCANFVMSSASSTGSTPASNTTVTTGVPTPTYTGAASRAVIGGAALGIVGVLAFLI